jgi:hypothetical protein
MASLEKYFAERDKNKPKPKWVYGDRITGKIGKIPVMGMVVRENYDDTSMVLVHLDLPVKQEGEYRWVMNIPAKGMKRLKEIE